MRYVSSLLGTLNLAFVISSVAQTGPLYVEDRSFTSRWIELKGFNNAGTALATFDSTNIQHSLGIPMLIKGTQVVPLIPNGTPNVEQTYVTGLSQERDDGGVYVAGTAIMKDGFRRAALWNIAADGTFSFRTMPNIILPEDSSAPGEQLRSYGAAVNKAGVLVGSGDSYLAGLATIWRPPYANAVRYLLSAGSEFSAINEAGFLLANGVEFDHGSANNRYAAAVLFEGGVPQEIPLLGMVPGHLWPNHANSMSGQWVAGVNHLSDSSRAFAWKIGSPASINLPNPPEANGPDDKSTAALSINASGNVVGYVNGGSYSQLPVLWRNENGAHIPYFFNALVPGQQYYSRVEQTILNNDHDEVALVERNWNGISLRTYKRLTDGLIEFASEDRYVLEEDGTVEFRLRLFRAPENKSVVTVNLTTVDGTAKGSQHFTAKSGSVSWGADEQGEKSFTVQLTDNQTLDESREFQVALVGATGAQIGTKRNVNCTIGDNYQHFSVRNQMQVGWNFGCAVLHGRTNAILKIERTGGTDGAVTFTNLQAVNITAQEGIDFEVPKNFQLSWAAGESGVKTVSIPLLPGNQPMTETKSFMITGTGTIAGIQSAEFYTTILITPKLEDAPPVIDPNAIQKMLDGFSFSISAVQGAILELEKSLGGLTAEWSTAATARSEDGEVRLAAPRSALSRYGFFRVKVRQD